jgi:hypothetical protein
LLSLSKFLSDRALYFLTVRREASASAAIHPIDRTHYLHRATLSWLPGAWVRGSFQESMLIIALPVLGPGRAPLAESSASLNFWEHLV